MNVDELDIVLKNLNINACAYEAYVVRSIDPETFTYQKFIEHVAQETMRLGDNLANQILEYTFAIIWCYANTPVDEGDMVAIKPSRHAPKGVEMINSNPNLIGMYVLPLFLYGAEYYSTAHFLLSEETFEPNDIFDVTNIDMTRLLSSLLETAMQARYRHISQCHLSMETGDGSLFEEHLGDEFLPVGKIIPAVEE